MKEHDIRERLYHRLLPAVPVPFTEERIIHEESHVRMAEYMVNMPIGGIAVWAHTGRGMLLTEEERTRVLTHWRESLPEAIIVAGAGSRDMADHAKALGANAILCHPPKAVRELPERVQEDAILEYHHDLARVGLPILLFYLYEAAGGIDYSPKLLRKLFAIPNVCGIKLATLDSIMTFQKLARFIKSEFPFQLILTGEDRFFGYSLMMGADVALVGMGAALTALQADMMQAFYSGNLADFHYRSEFVDTFAMATFTHPMEGYIQRMLYALSWLGIVSPNAIFDPWGPELEASDITLVAEFLSNLPIPLKR